MTQDTSSSEEDTAIAIHTAACATLLLTSIKKRKKRSCWIKEWKKRRSEISSYNLLMKELKFTDEAAYKNYLRMDDNIFNLLLSYVEKDLKHEDSIMREAISPAERLTAALRFLAAGETFQNMEFHTRLSKSFLAQNIPQICKIIYQNLKGKYLKFPDTIIQWKNIADEFTIRWQFPLCLGALDGKHINFRAFRKDGAFFHNYKGTNSIVLLALVDANCKFIWIEIGCNGRTSDGGVFLRSQLKDIIENSSKYFPPDTVIGNNRKLPYVIVADDAFSLHKHILKPYPYHTQDKTKRIFNIRHSRARHTVEHTFGILTNRFKILQNTINLSVEKVEAVVQACCVLHNFLIEHSQKEYTDGISFTDGIVKETMAGSYNNPYKGTAENIRTEFAQYFVSEGKVDWQESKL